VIGNFSGVWSLVFGVLIHKGASPVLSGWLETLHFPA